MREYWDKFLEFLREYKLQKVTALLQALKWEDLLTNVGVWAILIVFLTFVIWKRQYRLLLLAVSCVLLVLLCKHSIPPSGDTIALHQMLEFIGGITVLIGTNLYVFIIRDK